MYNGRLKKINTISKFINKIITHGFRDTWSNHYMDIDNRYITKIDYGDFSWDDDFYPVFHRLSSSDEYFLYMHRKMVR